jgi:drug/metabolite transporter (DMT)-like permease
MSSKKKAIIALIIANIIWGAAFPIYKLTLTNIPPFTFLFFRFFGAAIVLFPFVRNNLQIERKDWRTLIMLAFFGITFAITFLFLGLQLTSSLNAPIVLSSTPVLLLISATLFLKYKAKRKVMIGTLLGLLGVMIIIIRPLFEKGVSTSIIGNLFLLIATCGSVANTLLLKQIVAKYNPLVLVFWSCIIGSLPVLPLVFIENQTQNIFSTVTITTVLGLLFAILFTTALCHSLNAFGLKYISAGEIGVFSYVDPIATALVALPLLGEQITTTYLLGSLFVFLGIFIAEGRFHWHPLHRLR